MMPNPDCQTLHLCSIKPIHSDNIDHIISIEIVYYKTNVNYHVSYKIYEHKNLSKLNFK